MKKDLIGARGDLMVWICTLPTPHLHIGVRLGYEPDFSSLLIVSHILISMHRCYPTDPQSESLEPRALSMLGDAGLDPDTVNELKVYSSATFTSCKMGQSGAEGTRYPGRS